MIRLESILELFTKRLSRKNSLRMDIPSIIMTISIMVK